MKLYGSYVFKTKDPAIDALRTVMQDTTGDRKLTHKTLKQIEIDGGPSTTCMKGWFFGKTRRP